jgi:DNA-directed RNA polymerase subunit RPC12/RpoP
MEGTIWLFLALPVALVALGAVLAGIRRRPPSVEDNPGHCSSCETPMSLRRVSIFESLTLRGVWRCPHCGTRMRRKARVAGTAA